VENGLGFPLLRRGRSGVSLTNGGERLLPVLRDLVHAEALLEQQATELRGLSSGQLTIGSYSSISAHWLPPVLRAFQQDYPGITVRLMEGVHQELEDWMADYLVDFCLFSYPPGQNCDWIPLKSDPMLAVLPPDHPLAGGTSIRLEQLRDLPFIMPGRGYDCDVINLRRESAIEPNIKFSTIENYAALSMIECGLGISIMNELITKGRTNEVAMLPFDPPRHIVLGIAVPALANASPAAKRMIAYIRTMLAE